MTDIATALKSALGAGAPAAITVQDILAAGSRAQEPYFVTVDVSLDGAAYAASNVFTALGVSAHGTLGAVPSALAAMIPTLADSFTLTKVSFQVLPKTGSLASISLTGAPSQTKTPLTVGGLSAAVQDIVLTVDQPLSADRTVTLSAHGAVSASGKSVDNLGFTFVLPDCSLSLQLNTPEDPVDVDAVLAAAGVSTQAFQAYDLTELDVRLDLRTGACALDIAIERDPTSKGAPPIDPASGFALDMLSLQAQAGGGSTSAHFNAELSYTPSSGDPVLFLASADYAGGMWTLSASCTGDANPQLAPNGDLPLPALLGALDLPVQSLPLGLDKVLVDELRVDATVGGGGSPTFTFEADFGATIDLSSGEMLQAGAMVRLERAKASGMTAASGYSTSGEIALSLEVDGFALSATYDFGSGDDVLTVAASFDTLTVSGTYDVTADTFDLKVQPAGAVALGDLIAEVISLVTGDRNSRLSAPWDVLNVVKITAATLTFDISKQTFGFDLALADGTVIPDVLEITDLRLSYASRAKGGAGFNVSIGYKLFGAAADPIGFDPTAASSKPVPKSGLPVLQINGAVAGQDVTIATAPDADVASALASALAPLQPSQPATSPVVLPQFGPRGWVIGADLLIKQQVWLRFIFDDPQFYGAALQIMPAPGGAGTGSAYLQAIVGLEAEVSYQKIDDTLGVYSACLTLPPTTRNPSASGSISLPLCSVQLPSIAVQIYTDGDFLVNVGFPYNLDFSKSLSVQIEEYVGSGGVYFGRLSGADAPVLKDPPSGVVGTVIELGVGMRIGIYYSESFGPLSGSLSITAQGLFEGIFAEVTPLGGDTLEYYDILADLSVTGALSAELNFFIVSASLYVYINVYAEVAAIYGQPVYIQVSASIDVTLEAEINLGFFSISKSFSFSATLSDSFEISDAALTDRRLLGPLYADGPVSLAGHFATCPLTAQVEVWVTPVLTLNAGGKWVYVLDFCVCTQPPGPSPFYTLVELVLGWFFYAYLSATGGLPVGISFDSLMVDAGTLGALDDCIAALGKDPSKGFDADDLASLLGSSLTLNLSEIPSSLKGTTVSVAAFPLAPGIVWEFNGVRQPDSATADQLARDYFVMLAHAAVGYARDQLAEPNAKTPLSITELITAMDSAQRVAQAAGLTTRFLMHGNQLVQDSVTVSAYEAAGLESVIDPKTAQKIEFVLMPLSGSPVQLSTASATPSPTLYPPSAIAGFTTAPALKAVSWRLLPATQTIARAYVTHAVTALSNPQGATAGSLWRLPKSLPAQLLQSGPTAGFQAGTSGVKGALGPDAITPLARSGYAFATVIDLIVQRDPHAAGGADYYVIHSIRGRSRTRLNDLVEALLGSSPPSLAAVELTYPTAIGPTGTPTAMAVLAVDGATYIYVDNFSSQGSPSTAAAGLTVQAPDPAKALLYALQARALTNRGGFFLVTGALPAGLPNAAFDAAGMATVSLVVSFTPSNAGSDTLCAYHSALRVAAGTTTGDSVVVSSPDISTTQRNFMPGVIGFEASVTYDNPADDKAYGQTLNNLFHLFGMAPVIKGPGLPPIDFSGAPLVTSPLGDTAPRVYQRTLNVFTCCCKQVSPYVAFGASATPLSPDPDLSQDPYALVGATVDISHSTIVDTFGDALPLPAAIASGLTPITVMWTDDLLPVDQWPGVTTRYALTSVDAPVLTLLFDWNPPTKLDQASKNRLLQQYTAIYFQLERIEALLVTSLLDGQPWPVAAGGGTLAQQLQAVVRDLLGAIAQGANYAGRIQLAPPPVASFNTAWLFPLSVELVFNLRPDIVADDRKPSDFTVSAPIFPDQWTQASSTETPGSWRSSPVAFASALEAAFSKVAYPLSYKLMSGQVDEAGDPTYWILRYGPNAFNISLATPEASAASAVPRPLANQAVDRPSPTNGAVGGPTGPMDLDASMARFLGVLDTFLRPATAAPGAKIAADALSRIQADKYVLAGALSTYVLDTKTGAAASASAVDVYRQAMLKSSKAFYAVDGALSLDLAACIGATPLKDEFAVYGRLAAAKGQTCKATFSPSSAVLNTGSATGGKASISFGFTADHLDESRTVTTPGLFELKAIRTSLVAMNVPPATLPGVTFPPYLDGTWLSFVNPPAAIAVPSREVAAPLRALPVAPTPVSQGYSPAVQHGAATTLADLKGWTIQGAVRRRPVAQDVLSVLVEANVPPTGAQVESAPAVNPLVQALTNFEAFWAVNASLLGSALAAGPTDSKFNTAIEGLAGCCDAVAAAAPSAPAPAPLPTPTVSAAAFAITETPAGGDPGKPWSVQVEVDSSRSSLATPGRLKVQLAGCKASVSGSSTQYVYTFSRAGQPVEAAEALADTERRLTLPGTLDIIGAQTGRISYAIIRNGTLAPPFQYVTVPVASAKPLLPHLEQPTAIDVSVLATQAEVFSLHDYLIAYLTQLLATPLPGAGSSLKLQLTLEIAFPPLGSSQATILPAIARPIGFLTAQDVAINAQPSDISALATDLAAQVAQWSKPIGAFNPNTEPWSNLWLRLRTIVFAEWQATATAPLLSLTGAYIPLAKVRWLA